jgi:Domain of unknown function (DUF5668)
MPDYGYDEYYVRNRGCRCPRCASYWLMGPAVLITVGVLFLLEQLGIVGFGRSFPVLLIVIGVIKIAQRSAPDMGHIQPAPYYPPGTNIPPAPYYSPGANAPSGPPTIEGTPPSSEVKRG